MYEITRNTYVDVVRMLPTIPVYDSQNPGGFGYGDPDSATTYGSNPVALANLEDRTNENFRVRGNTWGALDLLPSLTYRLNLGYETSNDHYAYHRKEGSWTLNQPYTPPILNENRARFERILIENTLTFEKDLTEKHSLKVLVGQTFQRDHYSQI